MANSHSWNGLKRAETAWNGLERRMSFTVVRPVQIAYHVPDPRAAALRFAKEFGWGPFFLMEHIPLESCSYRGVPSVFDHSSAYGQAGDLMVELITQHDDSPSVLRDMYEAGQTGIHHVAQFVRDLDAELDEFRARGYDVALEASTRGVRFAMVDTRAALGHMLELYVAQPELIRFYEFVRRKSQEWDGREPLRRLVP